jgi:hypothetical protein
LYKGVDKKVGQAFKEVCTSFFWGINSDYVLTFAELKTIMKNLKNLP